MLSVITQSPKNEPVSVTQVRTDLRLDDSEDLLLASLITSARMIIEANTGSRLITQKWDVMFDHWPADTQKPLKLPHWPVQEVEGVYLLGGSERTQIDSNLYETVESARIPQLILKAGQAWPAPKRTSLGILVSLKVGFGDAATDVPEPLRQAIRQLVSFWYEQGEWHGSNYTAKMPEIVNTLMSPYRNIHL